MRNVKTPALKPNYRWLPIVLGALLVILSVYVTSLGDLTKEIPRFLTVFGVMFGLYAAAILLLSRRHGPHRQTLILIFVVAIACRVVYLTSTPTLSNDIYRYLWEGRAVQAGFNPFAYPPEASELESLRDDNYDSIHHRHLETIYPPLAQAAFYLGAIISPKVKVQRAIFVFFDMATMVLIVLLLRHRRRNVNLCAVYGWSPLVMLEFSHSGHMDSLGIFFLVLAVLLFHLAKKSFAVASLALSFVAKYFSAVLLPFLVCKKGYLKWLPVFALIVVVAYVPFAGAPSKLVSSLAVYGRQWEFNSLIYTAARQLSWSPDWIRLTLMAVVVLFALYQGYRLNDLVRYSYRVLGIALLLSPTIYPWYLCWIVPFLCFHPSRAWLLLTGAIVISYWVWVSFAATGNWEVGIRLLLIEYVPFLSILVYESYRSRTLRGVES
ncbi:MAG: hypothetical protein OEN01_05240 [Candidatus Krumholzibacteria bacterium]|nr:hypothetical protein [Candidatus Krumholzibacteria bacterium]